ncbi:zinc-binding protein A33-like [Thunnus albacares]|uniref:zinc-binding protein A33-like n=1 Tax=Thunnus albacares TaxID=8236 RepID=UPI001CF70A78|nr:zinc-binding protein A33-like [Thunnus albacares]
MIQKRRLKIQEIKHSVDLSKKDANREKAEGLQVFITLMESVERSLNELIETIEEKQRTTEKQAEDLRTVTQLEETLSKEMKKLFEAELKRVQQYAVDVTLDPDTAHPDLILSDDEKQVNDSDVEKDLPDNPKRFSHCISVLGKQSFSSGRFYFEVQVKGKTDWALGVARESINRKGEITLRPQDGYWTIWLRNGNEYKACAGPSVRLSLKSRLQKVGVFVDYEEGLVSFYDVDAAALIYSFTGCSFTEKLYPYFGPGPNDGGKNSTPLIICPVNQTE